MRKEYRYEVISNHQVLFNFITFIHRIITKSFLEIKYIILYNWSIRCIFLIQLKWNLYVYMSSFLQEIYKDRKKFSKQVFEVASSDLVNMGITVVSYTLKDIRDDEVNILDANNVIFIWFLNESYFPPKTLDLLHSKFIGILKSIGYGTNSWSKTGC